MPAVSGAKRPDWSVVVRDASDVERVVAVSEAAEAAMPLTIGRDSECAVRIESPYVSRFHARIEWQDGAATLIDLGSRNGSLLNGTRVHGSVRLSDGDVIAIGDATIRCRFGGALAEPTRTLVFHGATPEEASKVEAATAEAANADTLRVDADTYEVFVGDQLLPRRLSAQEFQLLSLLFVHRHRVCTRQELGDAIWGRDMWDSNMLHRLVHRLKEKLEPNPGKPRYVQTVPWIGYRLTP